MSLDKRIKDAFDRHANDAAPRPGAWGEIERRVGRSHRRRPIIAASGALFAIVAAMIIVPRIGPPSVEELMASGHYILMPQNASSPSDDGNGGADVLMTTNLPEGTLARVEYQLADPSTGQGGAGCCSAVSQGTIRHAVSGDCLSAPERQSRGFTIKVVVAPGLRGGRIDHPETVYDELGPNFERLKGAQVTTHEGMRALVVTGEYEWPRDKCQQVLDKYLLPPTCAPSGTSPNDDEGGENMQAVAGSVVVTLNQLRLCELYSYTTSAFKAATPWPVFRDRTKAWVDAHRPLERENFRYYLTPEIRRMSGERIGGEFNSPAWMEVDYFLRGERVGHARFVARLGTARYTRWQIGELQLF